MSSFASIIKNPDKEDNEHEALTRKDFSAKNIYIKWRMFKQKSEI